MATKNWGLQVPTKTTPLTPLATPFALLASSISDALTSVLSGSAKRGTAAQRDAFYGVPTTSAAQIALQGSTWFNTTTGLEETYYAAYSSTNQRGASAAGWSSVGCIYNLSPVAGATTSSAELYIVRDKSGLATLHGAVQRTAGIWPTGANSTVLNLPAGWRPRDYIRYSAAFYGSWACQAGISTAGALAISPSNGQTTSDIIYIDSPTFVLG